MKRRDKYNIKTNEGRVKNPAFSIDYRLKAWIE